MAILTDAKAKNIKAGDKSIGDGTVTGLMLTPTGKGVGKWELRFVSPVTGARRKMGRGVYPAVSIAAARDAARKAREIVDNGGDPLEEKKTATAAKQAEQNDEVKVLTFAEAAKIVHADLTAVFENPKHKNQWINTLRDYIFPSIGSRQLPDLKPKDFADALRPIWNTKYETAGRVKQRCSMVMRWAETHEIVNSNPLMSVDCLLPKQPKKSERVEHHPAMAWKLVPEFVQRTLRSGEPNVTKVILEFTILTGARSNEARGMRYSEVDFATRTWTVPKERMKKRIAHEVPLSDRALEIVNEQYARDPSNPLVFPSPRAAVKLSDAVFNKFLSDHKVPSTTPERHATCHGFTSSVRDWAAVHGFSRDLAEKVLAHAVSNQSEAAYYRETLLEQRRELMTAWADFVQGKQPATNVVALKAAHG